MPQQSIYFTDEQLPRAKRAAELDNRSLSQWVGLAVEAKLNRDTVADEAAGKPRKAGS